MKLCTLVLAQLITTTLSGGSSGPSKEWSAECSKKGGKKCQTSCCVDCFDTKDSNNKCYGSLEITATYHHTLR